MPNSQINRNSLGERVGRLEVGQAQVVEDIHGLRTELRQGLRDLAETVKSSKTPSSFWISLASIVVMLLLGLGSAAYVPVWITTRNINDKAQAALDAVGHDIPQLKATDSAVNQQLREVETQFRGNEQIRNIQFAEQQRMNNILMQIAQGAGTQGHSAIQYPSGPYYSPKMTPETTGEDLQ